MVFKDQEVICVRSAIALAVPWTDMHLHLKSTTCLLQMHLGYLYLTKKQTNKNAGVVTTAASYSFWTISINFEMELQVSAHYTHSDVENCQI